MRRTLCCADETPAFGELADQLRTQDLKGTVKPVNDNV